MNTVQLNSASDFFAIVYYLDADEVNPGIEYIIKAKKELILKSCDIYISVGLLLLVNEYKHQFSRVVVVDFSLSYEELALRFKSVTDLFIMEGKPRYYKQIYNAINIPTPTTIYPTSKEYLDLLAENIRLKEQLLLNQIQGPIEYRINDTPPLSSDNSEPSEPESGRTTIADLIDAAFEKPIIIEENGNDKTTENLEQSKTELSGTTTSNIIDTRPEKPIIIEEIVDDDSDEDVLIVQESCLPTPKTSKPKSRKNSKPVKYVDPLCCCDRNSLDNLVKLGPNGTKLNQNILKSIDYKNYRTVTRKLMMTLFDRETLATHTLSGKPSPAFLDCKKEIKAQLDPKKTQDIIYFVANKCQVNENLVRMTITTKCADENKMMRKRMVKGTQNKENSGVAKRKNRKNYLIDCSESEDTDEDYVVVKRKC